MLPLQACAASQKINPHFLPEEAQILEALSRDLYRGPFTLEILKKLLHHLDADARNYPPSFLVPLERYSRKHNLDENEVFLLFVDYLKKRISKNWDINAPIDTLKNLEQPPLLHIAAREGCPILCRALAEAEANLEHSYQGKTPIFFATSTEEKETVKTLIDLGANVTAIGPRGTTLLIERGSRDIELLNLFHQMGVNPNVRVQGNVTSALHDTLGFPTSFNRLLELGATFTVEEYHRFYKEVCLSIIGSVHYGATKNEWVDTAQKIASQINTLHLLNAYQKHENSRLTFYTIPKERFYQQLDNCHALYSLLDKIKQMARQYDKEEKEELAKDLDEANQCLFSALIYS